MTVSSFPRQSDYPVASLLVDGMQREVAEELCSADGIWTSTGPYDDDGELNEGEEL